MNQTIIAPQEASRRRRLVYASCQGVLSEKDSLTMVALCDSNFSQVETFTPFRFFKEAQTRFNLSATLVKTLMQRFNESQQISLDQLVDPTPSAMSASMPAGGPGSIAGYNDGTKTAEQIVFEQLVARLFSYLQLQQQPNVKNYLSGVLSKSKMPQAAKTVLVDSLQVGVFSPSAQKLASPEMIAVLDVLYSSYCELYGPVQADQIFSSIMSEVEMNVPEARQYSPRQFL